MRKWPLQLIQMEGYENAHNYNEYWFKLTACSLVIVLTDNMRQDKSEDEEIALMLGNNHSTALEWSERLINYMKRENTLFSDKLAVTQTQPK